MIKSLAVALVLVHWIWAPAMATASSQSPKTAEDYNNRGLELTASSMKHVAGRELEQS